MAIPGTNAVAGANAGFGGVEIPALAMGVATDAFFIGAASLSDGDEPECATVSGLVGSYHDSTVVPEPAGALRVGLALLGVAR